MRYSFVRVTIGGVPFEGFKDARYTRRPDLRLPDTVLDGDPYVINVTCQIKKRDFKGSPQLRRMLGLDRTRKHRLRRERLQRAALRRAVVRARREALRMKWKIRDDEKFRRIAPRLFLAMGGRVR